VPFNTAWYWALIDSLCEIPRSQDPADVSVPDRDWGNAIDNVNFAHYNSNFVQASDKVYHTLSENYNDVNCNHVNVKSFVSDNIGQFDAISNCNFISEGDCSSSNFVIDSKSNFVDGISQGVFKIFSVNRHHFFFQLLPVYTQITLLIG
jgi:hypothetical protein